MSAPDPSAYTGWTIINANLKAIVSKSTLIRSENIYDFAPPNFSGYPAVVISPNDEKGMAIDTVHNSYTFSFNVLCLQTRLNLSADQAASYDQAETQIRALVDDLTVRLNTDITVGGLGSAWSRPVSNKWGYIKGQDVDTRTCMIGIEIVVGQ